MAPNAPKLAQIRPPKLESLHVRSRRGKINPAKMNSRISYGVTIFVGAFLLFEIEPLIAKRILPWFGGAAAV